MQCENLTMLYRRKIFTGLAVGSICLFFSILNLYKDTEEDEPSAFESNVQSKIQQNEAQYSFKNGGRYIPPHRIVHFDLKGAAPKLDYIQHILPLVKEAGATGILLEYEDTFPYSGLLLNISAKNAYTPTEVRTIIKTAEENGLEVIPLIQTFGHMEHVLKLEEFKNLREISAYPQSICPSKPQAFKIITEMIDQVSALHPNSKWIHIGLDEVYQLGQCPICMNKLSNPETDTRTLFLSHANRVARYVKNNKKKTPIMWDDMLRSFPLSTLLQSGIGDFVEPMVWVYVEDIDRFIDSLTWDTYARVFPNGVWTTSAFKGAFGEKMYIANIQRHVGNNLGWLDVMRRESSQVKFLGIVLSGWSRYDHFAVLCELLPSSLPSLILNLEILSVGGHDEKASRATNKLLECSSDTFASSGETLLRDPFQSQQLAQCRWIGSDLFSLISSYDSHKKEVEGILEKITQQSGWITEYNIKNKFSSPYRVNEALKVITFYPGILKNFETQIKKTLLQFYDIHTASEWIEQHIWPLRDQILKLESDADTLMSLDTWPRRPLR